MKKNFSFGPFVVLKVQIEWNLKELKKKLVNKI